jgi:hypothetical protein
MATPLFSDKGGIFMPTINDLDTPRALSSGEIESLVGSFMAAGAGLRFVIRFQSFRLCPSRLVGTERVREI